MEPEKEALITKEEVKEVLSDIMGRLEVKNDEKFKRDYDETDEGKRK